LGFGTHEAADLRILSCVADGDGSDVVAEWQGRKLRYRVGAAGLHWARNCLAVLSAVNALGGDLAEAAESLATVQAVAGRGARRRLQLAAGTIDLVDESYNASPTSVRAMLGVLGTMPRRPGRRRVLVLGDMRELGSQSDALHESLVPDVVACGVDLVFACGPHMRRLYESLPAHVRAAHSADSAGLAPLLVEALRDGDVVAVKGSLGSKMKTVVEALLAAERTRAEAA
jgi:UDP-N-acetylmuramoyl-tripeptide--D-alanyl-D-alanine ligase